MTMYIFASEFSPWNEINIDEMHYETFETGKAHITIQDDETIVFNMPLMKTNFPYRFLWNDEERIAVKTNDKILEIHEVISKKGIVEKFAGSLAKKFKINVSDKELEELL